MASLLPNAKQQFIDINGSPLVGGKVYFYIPGTLQPKNTWQNPGQTILNTNPVILDSRGQAVIYGNGSYRQILKDSDGNTIWDQLTSAPTGGGQGGSTVTITVADSPYTIDPTVGVIFCDLSGGNITINLLAATTYGGELTVNIKGSAGGNFVSVVPNGSDTINDLAVDYLTDDRNSKTYVSDTVDYWSII